MRRRAIISGLLLVGVGVLLGTTVFRDDIAQATGLAQAVTVTNTPLPVREQNIDGNGHIKVHEQGTGKRQGHQHRSLGRRAAADHRWWLACAPRRWHRNEFPIRHDGQRNYDPYDRRGLLPYSQILLAIAV